MSRLITDVVALFVAPPAERDLAPSGGQPPREPREIAWHPPVAGPPAAALEAPAVDAKPTRRRPRRAGRLAVPVASPVAGAVIAAGADAVVLGAALAGEMRARHRVTTALVLVWHPGGQVPVAMPAWPAARALADALADGDDVSARGRLVELRLPQDPQAAAAAAARLTRESRVPTVLILAGPRPSEFDALLAGCDVVVVLEAGDDPRSLAGLVVSDLSRLSARVIVAEPIAGAGRRRLALAGFGRARGLGRRIEAALP